MVIIHNQVMDCMPRSHKEQMFTLVTTMTITALQKWKKKLLHSTLKNSKENISMLVNTETNSAYLAGISINPRVRQSVLTEMNRDQNMGHRVSSLF